MGAQQFTQTAHGVDAGDAFNAAHDAAGWQHGHGGYTGTLAEKSEYVVITNHVAVDVGVAQAFADRMLRDGDPRVDNKWGPAGAVRYTDPQCPEGKEAWLFFGWASC